MCTVLAVTKDGNLILFKFNASHNWLYMVALFSFMAGPLFISINMDNVEFMFVQISTDLQVSKAQLVDTSVWF